MAWRAHQVILRLRSPLHMGCGKVGNAQRTRPYIPGRALWGALTMRLTRDLAGRDRPANDSNEYRRVGQLIHDSLAFTYFYPELNSNGGYKIAWFWQYSANFRHLFLRSYSGTALSYSGWAASEGTLHEVEFISPYTMEGEPVFFVGYIFAKDGVNLQWQDAFNRLQIGGERGYGWGAVELVDIKLLEDKQLFAGKAEFIDQDECPLIRIRADYANPGYLLAHSLAKDLCASGEIEPLVGREWHSDARQHCYAGQYLAFNNICFVPGSTINQTMEFKIGPYGVWHK